MAAKKQTKKRKPVEPISGKRAAFLRAYLAIGTPTYHNAAKSAIAAGYSEKAAKQHGCNLLSIPEIREAIRQEDERALAAARVTRDGIIGELARIAYSDPRRVMAWGSWGLKLKESSELSDEEAATVAEVSQTITKDGGSIKLKMHSKVEALKELAKIGDLYPKAQAPEKGIEGDGSESGVLIVVPSDSDEWQELVKGEGDEVPQEASGD